MLPKIGIYYRALALIYALKKTGNEATGKLCADYTYGLAGTSIYRTLFPGHDRFGRTQDICWQTTP